MGVAWFLGWDGGSHKKTSWDRQGVNLEFADQFASCPEDHFSDVFPPCD